MFKNLILSTLIILGFIGCAYGKANSTMHEADLTVNYDITNYDKIPGDQAFLFSYSAQTQLLFEKLWGKGPGGEYSGTKTLTGQPFAPDRLYIEVFPGGQFPICVPQLDKMAKDWYKYKSFTLTMNGSMDDSGPHYLTFECRLDESN